MTGPRSFAELLELAPDELARCDIALINLLCATGLPGSEALDISACLATLDAWTEEVRQQTRRHFLRFAPKTPRDTPGFLRCWTVWKVLRHGKGLAHHLTPPDARPEVKQTIGGCTEPGPRSSFRSAETVFIHGLLGERKTGSCSSFPTLMVAVGQRLGYPLKLALSVGHALTRWDDPADTFNMDGGPFYINRHPDDYYVDQPQKWTDEEKNCGAFLRPLTPTETFGFFVGLRASVLYANFRWADALEMCHLAHRLFPQDPLYRRFARRIESARFHQVGRPDDWGCLPHPSVAAPVSDRLIGTEGVM